MLGFDRRQIVSGRDDATVENDEIVLAGIKCYVLATSANAIGGEGDKKIDRDMAGDAGFHKCGTKLLPFSGRLLSAYRNYSKAPSAEKKNRWSWLFSAVSP